jgi:hypothetical protein
VAVPVATTVKVAESPWFTLSETGWVVMLGTVAVDVDESDASELELPPPQPARIVAMISMIMVKKRVNKITPY